MSMKQQNEQLKNEIKTFNARRSLLVFLIVIAVTMLIKQFLPEDPADLGFLCTLPAVFLIVYIFATKRIIEALLLSTFVGWIFCAAPGENVLGTFSDSLTGVMMDEDTGWLIVVCGTMGGIIALIERAGGAFAFGEWAARRAKTEKAALMWTWLLGCVIFIDDYLNSCTVGSCMAPLTDKHKVPREMLAYVADSTAAPLCVLVPFTTWAVFAGRIMLDSGYQVPEGTSAVSVFIQTIPYNFYGWFAALLVPCVIFGLCPKIGGMKAAYERTHSGGPIAPEGSDKISIMASDKEDVELPETPRIMNFFIPILTLIGATILFDTDMQMGVICTVVVTFVLYMAQNIISASEFWDVFVKGIQNMVLPLLLMVCAFEFGDMNEQIGFTKWCIETGTQVMTPATAPLIVFLILAVTEFITGTNWGMYVIALPIIIPLSYQLGCSTPLLTAACLSAGVFGSHICFYSDATVITSAACGCDNFRHALTQMPFGFIAAGLSAIGFLVMGFVMA